MKRRCAASMFLEDVAQMARKSDRGREGTVPRFHDVANEAQSAACGSAQCRAYPPQRSCGRVAEGGGLLNRYRLVKAYRGFESLRLRQSRLSFNSLACVAGIDALSDAISAHSRICRHLPPKGREMSQLEEEWRAEFKRLGERLVLRICPACGQSFCLSKDRQSEQPRPASPADIWSFRPFRYDQAAALSFSKAESLN
jgi:hypothetical protein